METLIEQLHKLKEKLFFGDFEPPYNGRKYERGFMDGLHAAEVALRAILVDYELEKSRNEQSR